FLVIALELCSLKMILLFGWELKRVSADLAFLLLNSLMQHFIYIRRQKIPVKIYYAFSETVREGFGWGVNTLDCMYMTKKNLNTLTLGLKMKLSRPYIVL